MDEQEREGLVKEIRVAVLHDIQRALNAFMKDKPPDSEQYKAASELSACLTQATADIDKVGRMRF